MIENLPIPSNRTPPRNWKDIEPILIKYENKMLDLYMEEAENANSKEILWKMAKLNNERTRELYKMNKNSNIKHEVAFGAKLGYIDSQLLNKWGKQGYEKLCCMNCINTDNTDSSRKCICRIKLSDITGTVFTECNICGCSGCNSKN